MSEKKRKISENTLTHFSYSDHFSVFIKKPILKRELHVRQKITKKIHLFVFSCEKRPPTPTLEIKQPFSLHGPPRLVEMMYMQHAKN
jgi:hypothetical protein